MSSFVPKSLMLIVSSVDYFLHFLSRIIPNDETFSVCGAVNNSLSCTQCASGFAGLQFCEYSCDSVIDDNIYCDEPAFYDYGYVLDDTCNVTCRNPIGQTAKYTCTSNRTWVPNGPGCLGSIRRFINVQMKYFRCLLIVILLTVNCKSVFFFYLDIYLYKNRYEFISR